jgi:hypothetical protein
MSAGRSGRSGLHAVRCALRLRCDGDAAGTRVVRHQHQVTAGQADEGGQGGAFVATFFFLDLNDDFLAFAQDVLDVDAAFRGFLEVFAGDFFEWQEAVALGAEVDEGASRLGSMRVILPL